jgi:hypothetical protein
MTGTVQSLPSVALKVPHIGRLKTTEMHSPRFWWLQVQVEMKCWQCHTLSKICTGEPFLASSGSWWFVTDPEQPLAYGWTSPLSLSSHGVLPGVPVLHGTLFSMPVPQFSSNRDIGHTELGTTLIASAQPAYI